ncbi:MAG: asparagine synthase-related protein [archaeon]
MQLEKQVLELKPFTKVKHGKKLFNLKKLKASTVKKPSLKQLELALQNSVNDSVKKVKGKTCVFFSGGLDSGLIAFLLSKKIKVTLLTVGLKNSIDVLEAKNSAKLLGLPLLVREVKEKEVSSYTLQTLKTLNFYDSLQLQIALPFYILSEFASRKGFKNVFLGQGADELFCGYTKFIKTSNPKQLSWQLLDNIYSDNLYRDTLILKKFKLKPFTPFLELNFVIQAMSFPAKQNLSTSNDELRKRLLRKLAVKMGLPKQIALRKKKAIQYGSGLSKTVLKLIKV